MWTHIYSRNVVQSYFGVLVVPSVFCCSQQDAGLYGRAFPPTVTQGHERNFTTENGTTQDSNKQNFHSEKPIECFPFSVKAPIGTLEQTSCNNNKPKYVFGKQHRIQPLLTREASGIHSSRCGRARGVASDRGRGPTDLVFRVCRTTIHNSSISSR